MNTKMHTFTATSLVPSYDLIPAKRLDVDYKAAPILRNHNGSFDPVLDGTPVAKADWATLYTYIQRRFGLPVFGGDPNKELCGGWVLSTIDKDIFVFVSPKPSGIYFSIYAMVCETAGSMGQVSQKELKRIAMAYRLTLLDLLRPVAIDHVYFNILGNVDENDPELKHFLDADGYMPPQPHPHDACIGIPSGLVGTKEWFRLLELLFKAGSGDYNFGLSNILGQLSVPPSSPQCSTVKCH